MGSHLESTIQPSTCVVLPSRGWPLSLFSRPAASARACALLLFHLPFRPCLTEDTQLRLHTSSHGR